MLVSAIFKLEMGLGNVKNGFSAKNFAYVDTLEKYGIKFCGDAGICWQILGKLWVVVAGRRSGRGWSLLCGRLQHVTNGFSMHCAPAGFVYASFV